MAFYFENYYSHMMGNVATNFITTQREAIATSCLNILELLPNYDANAKIFLKASCVVHQNKNDKIHLCDQYQLFILPFVKLPHFKMGLQTLFICENVQGNTVQITYQGVTSRLFVKAQRGSFRLHLLYFPFSFFNIYRWVPKLFVAVFCGHNRI